MVKIFKGIAKQNENLSEDIKTKLEKGLNNNSKNDQILSIFALLGQKGKNLTSNVIERICNKFIETQDYAFKQ
jgi:hypothetical protein